MSLWVQKRLGVVALVSMAAAATCPGASGQLDPSFLPNASGQPVGAVLCALPTADTKIVIVGAFTQAGPFLFHGVARLKNDGALDVSFNPGTGADDVVNCAALQPDGKVLIGGLFRQINGVLNPKIARLNLDGSVDGTFVSRLDPGGNVNALAVQADGSIVVGGALTVGGHTNLARLKADGSIDATFCPQLSSDGIVNCILIQPDQHILVAGTFTHFNSFSRSRICRLNPDGALDSTFDPAAGPDGPVYALNLSTNGAIMLGGRFSSLSGAPRNYLGELNPDGSLSTAFSTDSGPNDAVYALAGDHDGVLVAGRFTEFNSQPRLRVARLLSDRSLDTSFTTQAGPGDSVYTVYSAGSSNVFIGGSFTNVGTQPIKYIARLGPEGIPDSGFNPGQGIGSDIYAVIPLTNGQILVGGGFLNIDGHGQSGFARLQPDGSLDSSFRPPLAKTFVGTAALQKTGKIVIGGVIYPAGATNFLRLARLNADGSFDPVFNVGTGVDARVQAVAAQPDDRILVIGSFLHFSGISARGLLRLNSEGSLDPTFSSGAGPDNNINTFAIQPDGRIIIGGDFTRFNTLARSHITRLNADGSLDPSFNPAAKTDYPVSAIAVLPDGKLLIGGDFSSVNGIKRNRLARLLPDGSVDMAFDPGVGPNTHVGVILPQTDGRFTIGGFFNFVDGSPRNYFARMNPDGTLDSAFQIGQGADFPVYALALQSDNKVLIGGSFGHVDGQVRSHIARLFNDVAGPPLDTRLGGNPDATVLTIRADANLSIELQSSLDLVSWSSEGTVTIPSGNSIEVRLASTNSRHKFYRVVYK
ncbi:MAG TPA: hypothetical protein VKY92_26210 [Verrucomicrobiae bacterium]|nr:hypothetical protein [Verrucomicrobiae bacterium]